MKATYNVTDIYNDYKSKVVERRIDILKKIKDPKVPLYEKVNLVKNEKLIIPQKTFFKIENISSNAHNNAFLAEFSDPFNPDSFEREAIKSELSCAHLECELSMFTRPNEQAWQRIRRHIDEWHYDVKKDYVLEEKQVMINRKVLMENINSVLNDYNIYLGNVIEKRSELLTKIENMDLPLPEKFKLISNEKYFLGRYEFLRKNIKGNINFYLDTLGEDAFEYRCYNEKLTCFNDEKESKYLPEKLTINKIRGIYYAQKSANEKAWKRIKHHIQKYTYDDEVNYVKEEKQLLETNPDILKHKLKLRNYEETLQMIRDLIKDSVVSNSSVRNGQYK